MSLSPPIAIKKVAERFMFEVRLPAEPAPETKHWFGYSLPIQISLIVDLQIML